MGKNKIVIVESPKKAKEIQKFLGKDFIVEATIGHFKDLPENELAVDLESFEPKFVIKSKKHKDILSKIKKIAENSEVIIATDPDREGYAIGYFMFEELKKKTKDIKRAEFHEITKEHIQENIKNALPFEKTNFGLFNAFLGRRVGDRIVGYIISPVASREIGGRYSVGRVQSPAVRLIIEREREIQSFIPKAYYLINTTLTKSNIDFNAFYTENKKSIESYKIEDKEVAEKIYNQIKEEKFAIVEKIEKKEIKKSPKPPFTTSTLQQTANSQLGFSPEKTMQLAQDLFEAGLITYHRTDSTRISEKAIQRIRELIKQIFSEDYLPKNPRQYKSKNTQADAHEAIRITNFVDIKKQENLIKEKGLTNEHFKLLKLIYERTLACQMADAIFDRTNVWLKIGDYTFGTSGSILRFSGYKAIYEDEEKEETIKLPSLEKGEKLEIKDIKLEEKWTKPPARYTEGSLIKKLEELGIGRPSTYATIIKTIKDRGYVIKEGNSLKPTENAFHLIDYLNQKYHWVIDYEFTKKMEDFLDKVEENKKNWKDFVKQLYEKSKPTKINGVSKKMLDYALDLAKKHNIDITDILEHPEKIKEFIDRYADNKPSEKQIEYAKSLAEKTGLKLDDKILQDKKAIKKWIDKAKKEAMKNYNLSEKQKNILIKAGKEDLLQNPEKALKWLNNYLKKYKKK